MAKKSPTYKTVETPDHDEANQLEIADSTIRETLNCNFIPYLQFKRR